MSVNSHLPINLFMDNMLQRNNRLKAEIRKSHDNIIRIGQKADGFMDMLDVNTTLFRRRYLYLMSKLDEYIYFVGDFNEYCQQLYDENVSDSRRDRSNIMGPDFELHTLFHRTEGQSRILTSLRSPPVLFGRLITSNTAAVDNGNQSERQSTLVMPSRSPQDLFDWLACSNTAAVDNGNQSDRQSTIEMPTRIPPDPFHWLACSNTAAVENGNQSERQSNIEMPSRIPPDPFDWLACSNTAAVENGNQSERQSNIEMPSRIPPDPFDWLACSNTAAAENGNHSERQSNIEMPSRIPPDPFDWLACSNTAAVENGNQSDCQSNFLMPPRSSPTEDPFDWLACSNTAAAENGNHSERQSNIEMPSRIPPDPFDWLACSNTAAVENGNQSDCQSNFLMPPRSSPTEDVIVGCSTDQPQTANVMQELALPHRGDRINVLVTHAYGSHALFGQLLQDDSSSDMADRPSGSKIARNLSELVMLMNPPTSCERRPHNFRPELGQLVGAVCEVNDKLSRARVMQHDFSKELVEVHYVDYGIRQWISDSELFELEAEWCWLAEQAVCFVLSDVIPKSGPLNISKARRALKDLAMNQTFNALIIDKDEDELIVQLFNGDGDNLSDLLIESGLFLRTTE